MPFAMFAVSWRDCSWSKNGVKNFKNLTKIFLHLRIILVYIANNSYLDDAGHRGDTGILNKH
jgi:hypothetical protein